MDIVVLLLTHFQVSIAHSWVERLLRVAPNGTMVGPEGFIRAYVPRTPGFDQGDDLNLVPPNGRSDGKVIHPDDPMCRVTQRSTNYSTHYPMLTAAPGDVIALQYQENGHVTLPSASKPENSGTIYIYGTATPSYNESLLEIHKAWTFDGKGGDERGRLLAVRNFDDGQCYQINDGTISLARQEEFNKKPQDPQGQDLWCQADIRLPNDLTEGSIYTIYWVWDWSTLSKDTTYSQEEILIPEIYTSCLDINVGSISLWSNASLLFAFGQDLNNAAINIQLKSL